MKKTNILKKVVTEFLNAREIMPEAVSAIVQYLLEDIAATGRSIDAYMTDVEDTSELEIRHFAADALNSELMEEEALYTEDVITIQIGPWDWEFNAVTGAMLGRGTNLGG